MKYDRILEGAFITWAFYADACFPGKVYDNPVHIREHIWFLVCIYGYYERARRAILYDDYSK